MKKYLFFVLIIMISLSCKNEKKAQQEQNTEPNLKANNEKELTISKLTLDDSFEKNDVRRYGVFPNEAIGSHPNTGNKKMDELLNLAELGVKLIFPEGIYKTVLNLTDRNDIEITFNKAVFTGAIIINGKADKIIKNITLNGGLGSYSSFASSFADKIKIDSLFIKNNEEINISGYKSSGCSIYVGTQSLYISYLEIEGTGSNGDQYRYTPAALMIHGKSPAPNDILIKHAEIKASDRHGAYLSGNFIEIEKLNIRSFAQGHIDNMLPIAYTSTGDEKKITGVWFNDFENSNIGVLEINTNTSPKATDALFLDSGDPLSPSIISKLKLNGKNVKIRKVEATNVEIIE